MPEETWATDRTRPVRVKVAVFGREERFSAFVSPAILRVRKMGSIIGLCGHDISQLKDLHTVMPVNFQDEFKPKARGLYQIFNEQGKGFIIPYYQRDYSWDEENIKQLMDDLIGGAERLLEDEDNMRFLGSSIVMEASPSDLEEIEERAQPTKVETIIDGQQRVSTFALLSVVLHKKIRSLSEEIPNEDPYLNIKQPSSFWLERLSNVYSLNTGFGPSPRKPIVIRKEEDVWTFEEDISSHNSYVSSYIFNYIHSDSANEFDPEVRGLVRRNVRLLEDYVNKISIAHIHGSDMEDTFPSGIDLIEEHIQKEIWNHEREDLSQILMDYDGDGGDARHNVNALANLFLLSSFFLDRCCMTVIRPEREELAFDMFQSLNATGTPLTAIEVFKPLVVKSEEDEGSGYKGSKSKKHFDNIERLFNRVTSTKTKRTRTNKLVTNFALTFSGEKLTSRFGRQRKWMQKKYRSRGGISEKRDFTKVFSDVSSYFYDAWILYNPDEGEYLDEIRSHEEADIASACFLYLKDVNHNISNGHLSRFYSRIINSTGDDPVDEFVESVKATAAFYTLWRSTQSTSGLDNVYRRLMRHGGIEDSPVVQPMRWTGPDGSLTSDNLKKYFRDVLERRNIDEEEKWVERSTPGNLSYDTVKKVCRFCLFAASHDTIVDDSNPGLAKEGSSGSSPYLTVDRWKSSDLQLEHIAPADPPDGHNWDNEMYRTGSFQDIGNLTLLPKNVNLSIGNKGWQEKRLYYMHLGLDDPDEIREIREEAEKNGISLSEDAIETLTESDYHKHLAPLTKRVDPVDHDFVQERGRNISRLVWSRISPWIFD